MQLYIYIYMLFECHYHYLHQNILRIIIWIRFSFHIIFYDIFLLNSIIDAWIIKYYSFPITTIIKLYLSNYSFNSETFKSNLQKVKSFITPILKIVIWSLSKRIKCKVLIKLLQLFINVNSCDSYLHIICVCIF